MKGLQGDELRRFAERRFIGKPELAEAITKHQTLQRQGAAAFPPRLFANRHALRGKRNRVFSKKDPTKWKCTSPGNWKRS